MDVNQEINYSNFRSQFTHEFGSNIKRILYKNSFLAGKSLIFQKLRSIKEHQIFIKEYLYTGELKMEFYRNDCKISDSKEQAQVEYKKPLSCTANFYK